MALNQNTLMDEDGEYSDWIEIYNQTAHTVTIQGWSLTDDRDRLQKWQFPQLTLEANGYLVVFASGKNRRVSGQELHTNFQLNGSGEYLALFSPDMTIATDFEPFYPEQTADVSFGYLDGDYIMLGEPTPGEANRFSDQQLLPAPLFSKNRGFYEEPFAVEITSGLQNTQIYYTLDGSAPGRENGTLYSTPVNITTTAILRAIAIKSGTYPSSVTTQTYLFLADVIDQPNDPPGYPVEWGPYTAVAGTAIGDYEMDPQITHAPAYGGLIKEALLSIPTISIATEKNNLFSASTNSQSGGIYIYTGPPLSNTQNGLGFGWERPASIEFFTADGSEEFQVDCGLRIQGGHSRRPEKSPKHSFRLVFRSEYGPARFVYPFFGEDAAQSYNTITLRAGFGNVWHHHSAVERDRSLYAADSWSKDTFLAMGHPAAHNRFVHLYLNGIYWGVYNPSERMDKDFAATYLGGDESEYDVIKDYTEAVDGNLDAWNDMMSLANRGLSNDAAYQRIQGNNPDGTPNPDYDRLVDVENIIDYMILNFYAGNTDWDHHNWAAMRSREFSSKGFYFLPWDTEHIFEDTNHNILSENNPGCPSALFQRLRENADFRRQFADRVQLLCFNGGLLTPQASLERWKNRADEIDMALIAESARWGDYRRDVHQYQPQGPFDLYTKNEHWNAEQDYLENTYFPNRTNAFLVHLRSTNLFPRVNAPTFSINGVATDNSQISPGDILTMSVSAGDIYYTTDGTDPFVPSSSQSENQMVLIAESADKRIIVPQAAEATSWRSDLDFDDSAWKVCSGAPGGVGYENNSGYESLITLDIGDEMSNNGSNPNPSCYIRIPFIVSDADLPNIHTVALEIRYDDGFVAYLNGLKIAEANAPTSPIWNSTATASQEAGDAAYYDVSQYRNRLTAGQNLLAIQGLNQSTTSSDFLITAKLTASSQVDAGDNISPTAVVYKDPITLNETTQIKARAVNGDVWSALQDVVFVIPQLLDNVKITEIHYHPLEQDDIDDRAFEFIELKNVGQTAVDLSGAGFYQGISYKFPIGSILRAGHFIVLASDRDYFFQRYAMLPFGEYEGFLDNAGERIVLVDSAADTLLTIRYNDRDPWPVNADGDGYSLVTKDRNPFGDLNDPKNWSASHDVHGSPGANDLASTDIAPRDETMVEDYRLDQNYPNPFNAVTTIQYHLPESAQVRLMIHNVVGRTVKTYPFGRQSAGSYRIFWNGTDETDRPAASGIYFYRILIKSQRRTFTDSRKMLLLR